MFTGIVELLAPIIDIQEQDSTKSGGDGYSITIGQCAEILQDCTIGDSICVNGTCLTVTEFDTTKQGGFFKIGVAPETLKKTNLGALKVGNKVNCERAMQAHTRFGGHFVQGHVDTTAMIRSVVPTGNALTLTLRLNNDPKNLPLPSTLSPYLIAKGYVTLDGASLTLIDVSPATGGKIAETAGETREEAGGVTNTNETVEFSVMLIRHTQEVIGLSAKRPGELVNVELDMVGKYVHRAVLGGLAQEEQQNPVDAGPAALAGEATSANDTLTTMIERTVRKVLAEQAKAS
ncbi:hypothetical protein CBS101457_001739 [Exobasidium rhododendri]|nr:hypothetical protein CBS101457_001739 [Exobasidium rhododendri]